MNDLIKRLSAFFPFCIIVFYLVIYTGNPLWDPDFFWHLKEGEYIALHREIPDEDPFSYTTPPGKTLRKEFILGQYWLSQLLFYLVWKPAGIGGIIILRAFLLSLTLLTVFLLVRKKSDPTILSVSVFLSGSILVYFTGERPQLFSFLGTALLVFIIERYKENRGKIIYSLPLLMLVWANLHGGVILGDVLLLIYVLLEGAKLIFRINPLETRKYYGLLFFSSAAIFSSLINPNTYHLFTAFYQFSESISQQMSSEFLSPFVIALEYKKVYWEYFVVVFLIILLVPVIIFRNARNADLSRISLVIFLSVISLVSARYMVFPAILFPLLAEDVSRLVRDRFTKIKIAASIFIIAIMVYSVSTRGIFSSRIHDPYPDGAVEFIKESKPEGNLFNYFDWGGYLEIMLPEYKVFIDGRGLDDSVRIKYTLLISGSTLSYSGKCEWQHILDNYNVNVVLLPWYNLTIGERIRLVDLLMHSPEWKLSYSDDKSAVFTRIKQK